MINQNDKEADEKSFEKMSNVLSASIALLGLCITVISLFQVTDKRAVYDVDELFAISSILFLVAVLMSYCYTRKNSGEVLKKAADIVFVSALISIVVAGIYLVLEL